MWPSCGPAFRERLGAGRFTRTGERSQESSSLLRSPLETTHRNRDEFYGDFMSP